MNDLEKQIDPDFKTTLGILGNKAGSGKSISLLAQIINQTFLSPKPSCKKNILNKVWIYENAKNDYIKTNLIVVPHYLINQWDNYLQFYTVFNYYIIQSKLDISFVLKKNNVKINNYPVIIVSNKFYNQFIEKLTQLYKNPCFSRVIFDDADKLAISNCLDTNACFMWFITNNPENLLFLNNIVHSLNNSFKAVDLVDSASYTDLCNLIQVKSYTGIQHNGFIKNLFKKLYALENKEEILPKILLKSSDLDINRELGYPKIKIEDYSCIQPLYNKIKSETLEIIANNLDYPEYIVEFLKLNICSQSELIYEVTEKYEIQISNLKNQLNSMTINNINFNKIHKQIIDLSNKSLNISNRVKLLENSCCPISYNEITHPYIVVPCCYKAFNFRSLMEYFLYSKNNKCPLCRSNFDLCSSYTVFNNWVNKFYTIEKTVCNIILKNPTNKFTIVCNDKCKIELIIQLLEYNNLNNQYERLSGSSSKITKKIENFKNGSKNILFVTSKKYGNGLNIDVATDIIFCEKVSNQIIKNIVGTSYRISRNNPLQLHYLFRH